MNSTALALVLSAGLIHATWNFFLKQTGGGIGVVWLVAMLQALFYAPLAIAVAFTLGYFPDATAFGFIVASALVHTAYFLLLDRGYKHGDLSIVYPLARATGPLLTVIAAIAFLGERPSMLALAGAGLVVSGALVLTLNPARWRLPGVQRSIAFALITGCMIAGYTVIDKRAVHEVLVPPLVLDWSSGLLRAAIMLPLARRNLSAVTVAWSDQRWRIVVVALLAPLSYILVLTAMVWTPVSYVAPAREVSILFAALAGTLLLGEGDMRRRLIAAGIMSVGVMALAIG